MASPAYLKRRGTPRTPADLAGHEAILGTSRGNTEWSFAGARRGAPPRLTGRLRVDDVETRLRAARDGRGIAQLLSYQVADDLAAGRLVRLLQAWERPPLPVHLVTKGRAHRAPKIDAFLDFAAKRLLALPVLRPGLTHGVHSLSLNYQVKYQEVTHVVCRWFRPGRAEAEPRGLQEHGSTRAGKVWRDHGALDYRECVGDDLNLKFGLPFPKLAKTKPGETVVFSYIVYKSRAHRDKVNAKVMADKRLSGHGMPKEMPFDMKRMTYGGFKTLVV